MKTTPKLTFVTTLGLALLCGGMLAAFAATPEQSLSSPQATAEAKVALVADSETTSTDSANRDPAEEKSAKSETPAANPVETLRQAREKLAGPGIRTIQARLIERVSIGGRRLRAEGTYLQAPDLKLRLEFEIKVASGGTEIESSLLEVCDGTILWKRQIVGSKPQITRRDVRQILRAVQTNDSQTILTAELALGGFPALLASLERSMVFNTQRDEEINGKKFVMIEGSWNEAYLDRFRKISKAEWLPDHVPDAVRLYFEPELLFPRRILFLKRPRGDEEFSEMLELDLVDIVLNGPVDDSQFDFVPPDGAFTVDITNAYIQQLNSLSSAAGSAPK